MALSYAAIQAKITSLFADNTTGDVSEADLREVSNDILDFAEAIEVTGGGGSGYDTPEEVRDALVSLTGNNRQPYSSIKDIPDLSGYFVAAGMDSTNLGTNPTTWDCASNRLAVAHAVVTSGVTLALSNATNLRNVSLRLQATNTVAIVLAGFSFTGVLPADVTWDQPSTTLTISNASSTEYMIQGEKSPFSALLTCNIQLV